MPLSVQEFCGKIRAFLQDTSVDLSREFPNVSFGISRNEHSLSVYLSALIKDASPEFPDLIDTGVEFEKSASGQLLINADVVWGADGFGCVEGSTFEKALQIDEVVMEKIYLDLPRLISILKIALKRRKPYDWDESLKRRGKI